MNDFQGQTVLITGAATGLGAAAAELAAEAGARVAVLDVNDADGRKTAERTGGAFWHLDVSSPAAWQETVADVEARLGPVRYAHLNAGIMTVPVTADLAPARLEDVTPERYRRMQGVNADGVFYGIQTLLPRMTAQGAGAITVTSSAAGLIPIPFDPVYAMTKHALVGLVRSLALAYADGPVRLNVLCPGGFSSDLLPPERRESVTMTPREMAMEAIDLLLHGGMGEVRLKLRKDLPAEAVPPPGFSLG
ncbi:MAG: SDR family NAD(P)-dependent oxidoreductase [Alphaproteobacteria bacterium]|nr:SDR family NAD(P)-dependent oxidoreductase [Alphaproteobacteria bacterium]